MTQKTLEEIIYSNPVLEELTFHNILYFRREELNRIMNGESAVDVIPESNQRSKLLRDGVLMAVYVRGGKRIQVTPRAVRGMEVLEDE